MSLTISLLHQQPVFIPEVAAVCCNEWPWYYDNGNIESAISYHSSLAKPAGVPCTLIALDNHTFAGTISILEDDMDIRNHLTPWLGCLFVAPPYRRKRVAAQLVEAALNMARQHGITALYAWTEVLSHSMQSRGWSFLERVEYQGKEVDIFLIDVTEKINGQY